MPGKREDVCIWKGRSVHAWGEGGYVYTEWVQFTCMWRGRMCVYGRGGVCIHGRKRMYVYGMGRVCVYVEKMCHILSLPMHTLHPIHIHTSSLSSCMHNEPFHIHISSITPCTHTPPLHPPSPRACTLHPFCIQCIWEWWSVHARGEGG